MKSEGVKDIFKWLEAECKKAKINLDNAKEERKKSDSYMHDWLDTDIKIAEAELAVLVRVKKSTEKYMKKLSHEGQ